MNVEYLIQVLNNKMTVLSNAKSQAFMTGDLATINQVEADMASVADTIYKLQLLLQVSQGTASNNTSLTQAMQIKTSIVTDGSTDVLNYYDLSTYAADPLYLQKITDILSAMGPMISSDTIDAYIGTESIGSTITGQMILNSAQTYNVDVRLLMAILELESNFGTAGVGAKTFNPGNVGNTGSSTQTYNSWQDGVSAVAQWLSLHPAISLTSTTPDDTTATTTDMTATTTPATSTSTIPFTVTAVPPDDSVSTSTNATSTTATSTDSSTGTATSTADTNQGSGGSLNTTSIATSTTATSTPPTTATTTLDTTGGTASSTSSGGDTSTSTVSTSTDPTTATPATSTTPIVTPPEVVPPAATSTPDSAASTTQAIRKIRVKNA